MAITQVSNSLVKQDLTISGGTVDNTVIGSGTPAAGTFTTVAGTLASTVTGTTQAASDNSTKIATTAYVTTALANLVDSAPGTLNTLNELAAALGDDANFATTVTNSIATKANSNAPSFTGNVTFDSTTLTVDATNNRVGIGTATPQRLLTLFENDQPVFQITNNTSGGQSTRGLIQYIANGTTTAVFDNQGSGSGGQFTFMQAGATRMVIDTNGRVGIGATSPSVLLDLESTAPTIRFTDSDATGTPECEVSGAGGDIILRADRDNEKSDSLIKFEVDGAERMQINANGNVGIGLVPKTTSNTVTGSLNVDEGGLIVRNSNQAYFASNIYWDGSDQLKSHSAGYGIALGYIPSDGSYRFFNTTASASGADQNLTLNEKVRIDTNGNVGINAAGASDAAPLQDFQVIHHSGGGRRGTLYYNQDNKVALASLNASSTWENLAIEGANISFKTGGTTNTDALTIDSSGGVNIGGSTAANKTLEIKGASNNDGYLGTFGSGYSLQVARHPTTGAFNNTSTAAAAINLFTASADSSIAFYTTTSNNSNPSERMRIDKSGHARFFHNIRHNPDSSGHRYVFLNRTSGHDGHLVWQQSGTNQWQQVTDSSHNMRFYSYQNGAGYQFNILSSGGISFGTDLSQAGALDDYEEGTYATSFTPSNGTITLNASYDELGYTKIGNVVTVTGYLKVSSVSNPSGILYIGLPFTAASSAKYSAAALCVFNVTGSGTTSDSWSIIDNNSNTIQVYNGGGGSVAANWANRIVTNTDVRISATYIAA